MTSARPENFSPGFAAAQAARYKSKRNPPEATTAMRSTMLIMCLLSACSSSDTTPPLDDSSSLVDESDTDSRESTPADDSPGDSRPADDSPATDDSPTTDDSDPPTCPPLTDAVFAYSFIDFVEGGSCGDNVALWEAYGVLSGFAVGDIAGETFSFDYDGFSVETACTIESDCQFSCDRAEDSVSLSYLGLSANLEVTLQSIGTIGADGTLSGDHAITLECFGVPEDCETVRLIAGADEDPCSSNVAWSAAPQ